MGIRNRPWLDFIHRVYILYTSALFCYGNACVCIANQPACDSNWPTAVHTAILLAEPRVGKTRVLRGWKEI